MLDVAADIGKRHHRPVTVHGMPALCEVPLSVRTRSGSIALADLLEGELVGKRGAVCTRGTGREANNNTAISFTYLPS